jgi:hypothetical protein
MTDQCPICFDDMDMKAYEDERESTTTCFKLECKHAFHTKCIVDVLSQTGRKCPNCNQNKSPSELLTKEGLAKKLLTELKRTAEVRLATNEVKESIKEFKQTLKILKNDIKKYSELRKVELGFDVKRKYMIDSLKKIPLVVKAEAKQKGAKYWGAVTLEETRRNHYWGGTAFERAFFGKQMAWKISRLKNATIFFRIR